MDKKTDTCFTCDIVSEYTGLANQFTQDLSTALLGPMWVLFLSLAGLWIVIQGLRIVMGHASLMDFGKEFMFVMIAGFLLSGQGPELVNNIYRVSLSMMGSAASVALQVGGESPTVTASAAGAIPLDQGMTALVGSAESGVKDVFRMAGYIASEAAWDDPLPILYALVLLIPYFLVLVVYFSQVVIAIFRIMMLATLSPYLMLGLGFGWGRDMMKSGLRTLISAFMVLFGATAALAVMLYGVRSLNIGEVDPELIRDIASIDNPEFLLAVAMGWLGTAFMTEATGMANSIAGSSLTNTGVGVITAGATASALALKNNPATAAAMRAAGPAGAAAGWAVGGLVTNPKGLSGAASQLYGSGSQAVQDLVAKAKNYGLNKKD